MSQSFNILNETLFSFNVPGGVTWSISFEPFPTIISTFAASKGGNSLGTSPSDGNAYIVLISALWPNSSSNAAVEATARLAGSRMDALAASTGMLKRFRYFNYADPLQQPLQSYGPDSYQRLCQASKQYDSMGVVQRLVPGGFKLGNCSCHWT
jgi:hypothetical protein